MARFVLYSCFLLLFFSSVDAQDFFGESAKLAFGFYHKAMSPLKSSISECQFTPSCSRYAEEAIRQYGFAAGSCLAAERLMRCSYHARPGQYPMIGRKFYDPAAGNYVLGSGDLWHSDIDPVSAKSRDTLELIPEFSFAYHLNRQRDFASSILELRREQFFNPKTEIRAYSAVLISVNYLLINDPEKAMAAMGEADSISDICYKWNRFVVGYLISDLESMNLYNISLCSRHLNSFPGNENEVLKLQSYAMIREGLMNEASGLLADMRNTQDSSCAIAAMKPFMEIKDFSGKSSFLAGLMSALLPGSGYFYCGDIGTGFSALSVNALFGLGIYYFFKNENYGPGILLSSFAFPFYAGNIIGSANCARSWNDKRLEGMYENYRKELGINFYFSMDFLDKCWRH